jgi:hypothetical protein
MKWGSWVVVVFLVSRCTGAELAATQPGMMAEFAGSTPCGALPQVFPGIRPSGPCERILWELTLGTNRNSTSPATFTLVVTYGMQAHGSSGFIDGGTKFSLEGTWAKTRGTKNNPGADVYELTAKGSKKAISFARVGNDLLHLLNEDKSLMIGDASWSYTLNRKARNK